MSHHYSLDADIMSVLRRLARRRAIAAYYDSRTDQDMREESAWGEFAEQEQFAPPDA